MQRSKLISYIKHPELLEDLSFEELQRWVIEFPYSQNLRTLLAKKVIDEGLEDKHADVLHDAALYSSDRSKLYDTINADQEQQIEEMTKLEEQVDSKKESPTFIEKLVKASSMTASATETVIDDVDAQNNVHLSIDAENQLTEDLSAEDNNTLGYDNSEMEKVQEIVKELEQDHVEMEGQRAAHSDPENQKQVGLSSFSQWLLELEQHTVEESEYDSDDGVISESLAKILESQGHTHKAAKMYEKLSLKYPEKSGYFAAQIDKITS